VTAPRLTVCLSSLVTATRLTVCLPSLVTASRRGACDLADVVPARPNEGEGKKERKKDLRPTFLLFELPGQRGRGRKPALVTRGARQGPVTEAPAEARAAQPVAADLREPLGAHSSRKAPMPVGRRKGDEAEAGDEAGVKLLTRRRCRRPRQEAEGCGAGLRMPSRGDTDAAIASDGCVRLAPVADVLTWLTRCGCTPGGRPAAPIRCPGALRWPPDVGSEAQAESRTATGECPAARLRASARQHGYGRVPGSTATGECPAARLRQLQAAQRPQRPQPPPHPPEGSSVSMVAMTSGGAQQPPPSAGRGVAGHDMCGHDMCVTTWVTCVSRHGSRHVCHDMCGQGRVRSGQSAPSRQTECQGGGKRAVSARKSPEQ
jgi:hypothetical protein